MQAQAQMIDKMIEFQKKEEKIKVNQLGWRADLRKRLAFPEGRTRIAGQLQETQFRNSRKRR